VMIRGVNRMSPGQDNLRIAFNREPICMLVNLGSVYDNLERIIEK
jgi:hypothetical protein